ncbi:ImpA family type VI secretion system protein [Tateyamaria sp. syn59]|uniref:type VI secretion system protein TssA n=1 Tax=Tateyamaria sp. syn59 TaxID=2576942 RepID=UPI0011BE3C9E|nr:type VI secretion system ImpA family N-terminal domain-containing protein [Tateyamaria sp. syn59]
MPDDSRLPQTALPIGENPRESNSGLADYRRLRDARSAARAEERRQEGAEPAKRVLKIAPHWLEVADTAAHLLDHIGLDIEVTVWLIEARTRLSGFSGLGESLVRLADMVEAHGADLHPQPEDALDRPFDIIGALNGVGREGTLIAPLRLVPLAPDGNYGEHGVWNVTDGGAAAAVAIALEQAGSAAIAEQLRAIEQASSALERCDSLLGDLLGPEAPPFNKIEDALDEAARTIRSLAADILNEGAPGSAVPATETPDSADASPADLHVSSAITSREDAFGQMLRIAAYFRRAEPHSPIADALETLVRRGRMDFATLLAELIPDEHARTAVMTTAGIGRRPDNNQNGE